MSLRQDWGWTFAADQALRLGPLLVIGALYLGISPEAGAEIVVAYGYAMLAWLVIDLGLGLYGTRLVAEGGQSPDDVQAEISSSRLWLSLVANLGLAPCLLAIGLSVPETACFMLYLTLRSAAPDWRLKGERRFKALAYCSLAAFGVLATSLGLLLAVDGLSVVRSAPFAIWSIAYVIAIWFVCRLSPARVLQWPRRSNLRHIRTSWSLSVMNAAMATSQQVPIIALSTVMPPARFAAFALLHRVALSVSMLFVSLGAAVFPRFVKAASRDYPKAWRASVKLMGVIGVISACLGVVTLAVVNLPWIETELFPGLTMAVALPTCAYMVARSVRIAPTRLLVADHRERAALWAVGVPLLLQVLVAGALVLIGAASVAGIVAVFLAAEVLALVLATVLCSPTIRPDRRPG